MKKLLSYITTNKKETIIVFVLLVVSGIAHAWNMFHFPYYENDEGVYMSQAWSLVTQGKLAPYTYWYDHAPGGWIFIALWTLLTGGFFTFGFSLNTGRVFMLVLHVLSTLFLYLITKKLTNNKLASSLAVLFFALSPLGIYFQRRVILDNLMTFWVLFSLMILVYCANKLRRVYLSAVTFGISVLSKENAVFLIPGFLYITYLYTSKKNRLFSLIGWLTITCLVISVWVLYALLKGEFFPSGTLLGGSHAHVSLIDAVKFQTGRAGGSILDFSHSSFWYNFHTWVGDDPVIIYLGFFSTLANLLIGIKRIPNRLAGILSASLLYYLMRGGLVIEFYITPLIPLLALNIGVLFWSISIFLRKIRLPRFIAVAPMVSCTIIWIFAALYFSTNVRDLLNIYTSDQTTPQIQAVNWILSHNLPNATYVIDNYGYIELHNKQYSNFKYAEWYWKVDEDPAVRYGLFHNDEKNISFVALTPQMKNDIKYSGLGLSLDAWKHSRPIVDFSNDYWDVDIWGNTEPQRILMSAWDSYKTHFMKQGRVIDPEDHNNTTSEGQAYALLRSVWMNDQTTFNQTLSWTNSHLAQPDNLFSWKWTGSDSTGKPVDSGTATDADQNMAESLLFAYKQWHNPEYLNQAKKIISAIWHKEVVIVADKSYVTAGNWATEKNDIIVNPSYLSPSAYRMFESVDTTHPWKSVLDTSYEVLTECTSDTLDQKTGGLPPEWCAIDKKTGKVKQTTPPEPIGTEYGFNAFRIPWTIAMDYQWYKDPRDVTYLKSLQVLEAKWNTDHKLLTAYQHDGSPWENYESVAAYSGDLGYFTTLQPKQATTIYTDKILQKFYEDKNQSYWEDPKNYYTQNWGWFATGLYSQSLPNLWQ